MPVIWGDIVFDTPASFTGATVYVRILDVSRADALSDVVAESILPKVSFERPSEDKIPFSLTCPPLDQRRSYAVEVHIDVNGSGSVSAGDFLSMESIPVSTADPDSGIVVRVRPV